MTAGGAFIRTSLTGNSPPKAEQLFSGKSYRPAAAHAIHPLAILFSTCARGRRRTHPFVEPGETPSQRTDQSLAYPGSSRAPDVSSVTAAMVENAVSSRWKAGVRMSFSNSAALLTRMISK